MTFVLEIRLARMWLSTGVKQTNLENVIWVQSKDQLPSWGEGQGVERKEGTWERCRGQKWERQHSTRYGGSWQGWCSGLCFGYPEDGQYHLGAREPWVQTVMTDGSQTLVFHFSLKSIVSKRVEFVSLRETIVITFICTKECDVTQPLSFKQYLEISSIFVKWFCF